VSTIRRADHCVIACAEIYRGDGEILANPTVGTIPFLGARLARATFEPDLTMVGMEAMLTVGTDDSAAAAAPVVEGWLPYRLVFDIVWSGRRHVVMGASQVDRNGNTNISSIGAFEKPSVQLLGPRGAPGNTVNHQTSYWVPNHNRRVFVDTVDFVSGVGPSRAAEAGGMSADYNDIRAVISDLCVIDFKGPGGCARLASLHPGVTFEQVQENTGFPLGSASEFAVTRDPTGLEMQIIERMDPEGRRYSEVGA